MTEFDPQSEPPPASTPLEIGPMDGSSSPDVEVADGAQPELSESPDSQNEDGSQPVTTPLGQADSPISEAVDAGDDKTAQDNAPQLPDLPEPEPRPSPPWAEPFEPLNSWREDTFAPRASDQAGMPVRRGGGEDENPEDRIARIVDQRIEAAKAAEPPDQYRINPYISVFPFQAQASGKWKELTNSGSRLVFMTSGRMNTSATGLGASINLASGTTIASGTRGLMVVLDDTTSKRFVALTGIQPRSHFELDVLQVGGTQGVLTSASQTFNTFKYKCMLQSTTTPILAASATPIWKRLFPGPVTSATHGVGFYDKNGAFKLATVDEQVKVSIFVGCT